MSTDKALIILLLNPNRQAYVESPTVVLDLTLKGQFQGHAHFKALFLRE